jgi:hypothetical protein
MILRQVLSVDLKPRQTAGASVTQLSADHWQLTIPAGPASVYRWAQLDDYMELSRKRFNWRSPVHLSLDARISNADMQGTWGFGFWNDPFSASLGMSGMVRQLPTLPECAWFFYASQSNYLSLRDGLPAQGFLAATFSSSSVGKFFLPLGLPFIPFLFWKRMARLLRSVLKHFIQQDAQLLSVDPTTWHQYELVWQAGKVIFRVDGEVVKQTTTAPHDPLGFVLWLDNQYAAFQPDGMLKFGTLPNLSPISLEIRELSIW